VDAQSLFTSPPGWLARLTRWITRLELALGAVALLLIFFLVLVQALQRHLPFDGWPWTGELATFSLVWLTFVVAGVLVTKDAHIAIEMVDAVPSPALRRVTRVVSCLIVAAVGVWLTVEAWTLTEEQGVLKSPALRMPMSWLYGICLLGVVSVVVRAVVAAARYAIVGVPDREHSG
jgi:TRAP-type C4-dicarboxylate transport system permease small subunit